MRDPKGCQIQRSQQRRYSRASLSRANSASDVLKRRALDALHILRLCVGPMEDTTVNIPGDHTLSNLPTSLAAPGMQCCLTPLIRIMDLFRRRQHFSSRPSNLAGTGYIAHGSPYSRRPDSCRKFALEGARTCKYNGKTMVGDLNRGGS